MTFEEFKLNFEIFSKIDTPEKLSICEQQYRTHIIAKEDNNFFEPLDVPTAQFGPFSDYTTNLHSILGFSEINNDQILFLIQPSFEPEHLLIIEKVEGYYALTHVVLEESYWLKYSRDKSISTARTRVSKGFIEKTVGDQVFALLEQSLIEAKKSQSARIVLDGIKYMLSKIVDGTRRDVFKHSPDQDSKTGRIIQLLETIIELTAIDSTLDSTLDSQKKIEHLINLILNEQILPLGFEGI